MEITKEHIEDFISRFGSTEEELYQEWSKEEDFWGDISEWLLNMGYRYIEKYDLWVHRDEPQTEEDIEIFNHLTN